jgi:hypothetical protein
MSPVICQLADRLRDADSVTSELFSRIIRDACWRLPSLRRTKDFDRLERLVQSAAWIDAALALLALETPQWRIRRLVCDDSEWHCTLSRHLDLPDWLDESVEACHADPSLAILIALVEVKCESMPETESSASHLSLTDRAPEPPLCCDNFM